MADCTDSDEADVPAGDFSAWLDGMRAALRGERSSDVPCDGCTACCRASQFIEIEPDETATLARIPPELRFAAPRRPRGHVLLGYDERGHCPMLVEGRCSIYEDRPRACRTYDCRVLAAAGVDLTEPEKAEVGARARRWRFAHPSRRDDAEHAAVRTAAAFLAEHRAELPDGAVPAADTARAVLAISLYETFLGEGADGAEDADPPEARVPEVSEVRSAIGRHSAAVS